MTASEIERRARAVPEEERPVPDSRLAGFGSFLGIYGGEHIAATEFVIGALLVSWGVPAKELLLGLVVGNLLAASSYALVTAPIAVDTRLTLFAYLRKATGPWFQRAYNAVWGVISVFWASSMMAISASSLKETVGLSVQQCWYPTSVGCVVLTLLLVLVTVCVAAYGFRGVARFSSLCVPWMVVVFFCGAAVSVPLLCERTGFGPVRGAGDFLRLLETHVFSGNVPEGSVRLSWKHVAAFAWMCGFVYHVGLNDMSIFRYARRSSYGWVGLFGMFLGHFFAWVCAGVMGAAAAACVGKELSLLDPGLVAGTVLGGSGLLAVIVAGWTTATPNIYRASLSFATFLPRWSLRRLSFLVGAVIAVVACFPAVMRIDWIATAAALLVPPVGAICLVEHWVFPRLGLVRHASLYRGWKVNPAALAAWLSAVGFAIGGVTGGWMHPFYLPIPTFAVAGLVYPLFAVVMGVRRPVAEDIRRDIDAVESRIAELGEETARADSPEPIGCSVSATALRGVAALSLLTLVLLAVWWPSNFNALALSATMVYFAAELSGAFQRKRKRRKTGS